MTTKRTQTSGNGDVARRLPRPTTNDLDSLARKLDAVLDIQLRMSHTLAKLAELSVIEAQLATSDARITDYDARIAEVSAALAGKEGRHLHLVR